MKRTLRHGAIIIIIIIAHRLIVSIVANGQKMILESQNQNFEKINKSLEKIEANFKQNGVNS